MGQGCRSSAVPQSVDAVETLRCARELLDFATFDAEHFLQCGFCEIGSVYCTHL